MWTALLRAATWQDTRSPLVGACTRRCKAPWVSAYSVPPYLHGFQARMPSRGCVHEQRGQNLACKARPVVGVRILGQSVRR